MDKWVANLLAKEKAKRKIPLEAKKLNNNYYLYHSTTRWDKKEKKNKKVTNYIGRITPKGVIEKGDSHTIRSIYEYGNSQLIYELSREIIEPLNETFPFRWEDILACAMVKTIEPLPLKMIKTRWEKLHISEDINASLSPNTISNMLREIGMDYASQKDFFDGLIANSKIIAFDLSSIFSQSVNLKYAEKGHNANHLYLNQINLMLFFSLDKQLPVL